MIMETVNCTNLFNDVSLKELIEKLENGYGISIYIDCIGFNHEAMVKGQYLKKLKEIYGDRFEEFTPEDTEERTYIGSYYHVKRKSQYFYGIRIEGPTVSTYEGESEDTMLGVEEFKEALAARQEAKYGPGTTIRFIQFIDRGLTPTPRELEENRQLCRSMGYGLGHGRYCGD